MSAELLSDYLTLAGVPQVLLDEVPGEQARLPGDGVRHPIGGWDRVPGVGDIRMWADINLVHWFDTAARHGVAVFGPHTRERVVALETGARIARASGEGVRTLWGVDVHADPGWVWINDLVVYGPPLSDEATAAVSAAVYEGCDGHAVCDGPNRQPADVVYVMTTWAAGLG